MGKEQTWIPNKTAASLWLNCLESGDNVRLENAINVKFDKDREGCITGVHLGFTRYDGAGFMGVESLQSMLVHIIGREHNGATIDAIAQEVLKSERDKYVDPARKEWSDRFTQGGH